MTRKDMESEIHEYFRNLILNSTIEDWKDSLLVEDNTRVSLMEGGFKVEIFTDSTYSQLINYFYYWVRNVTWSWDKETRQKGKLFKTKYQEIKSYLDNSEEYKKTLKTYNLLPIKEQRRRKLEEIKNKI